MRVSFPSQLGDEARLDNGRTRMATIVGLMLGGRGWVQHWEGNDGYDRFDAGRAMLAATLGDDVGLDDGRTRIATIIGLPPGG